MSGDNILKSLVEWFKSECDGNWEQGDGISIESLDNPGWSMSIDLPFEEEDRVLLSEDRAENDWIRCKVEDGQFRGFASVNNLNSLIKIFLDFVRE